MWTVRLWCSNLDYGGLPELLLVNYWETLSLHHSTDNSDPRLH